MCFRTTAAARMPGSKCLTCGLAISPNADHSNQESKIQHWILNGLSREQKLQLHRGPCFEKLTAIPVEIGAFAFLEKVARKIGLIRGAGEEMKVRVLHPTCGIGVSSMVLSMFFGKVHMGDYQPEQLCAAEYNINHVFNLGDDPNISIDKSTVNLLDRNDFDEYDIVVLDPNWGSDYQEKCKPGAYRMLVRRGKFDPNSWEDVWTTSDASHSSRVTAEGADSLESVVAKILSHQGAGEGNMIVLVQVPSIYDFKYMKNCFKEEGLEMKIYDPSITPPPSNISPQFLRRFEPNNGAHERHHLINTFSEEYKGLQHYHHYHGKDRYVAVYRANRG